MKAAQLLAAVAQIRASGPRPDFSDRSVFIRHLMFLHNVIVASEPLVALAASKSAGVLRDYFEAHLEEERGHEAWLAEDLASAGVTDFAVAPEAVAMVGSEYYLVAHVDPAALLGYMAVLECFPISEEQIDALESLHGAELCRTLRYHALHDVDHGADVLSQIDALDDARFVVVMQNAIQTALYARAAFAKLCPQGVTA